MLQEEQDELQRQQHQPPSPPLIDEELLQLQMVQSLIKDEPSKIDLTQVIMEAVAAAAAGANAAVAGGLGGFGGLAGLSGLAGGLGGLGGFGGGAAAAIGGSASVSSSSGVPTRSKNFAEMFNCSSSADEVSVRPDPAPVTRTHHNPFQALLQTPQQLLQQQQSKQSGADGDQSGGELFKQRPRKCSVFREHHTIPIEFVFFCITTQTTETRVKKKKSRWGGTENDKTFIPGMPTILPASLDSHQQEAYLGNLIRTERDDANLERRFYISALLLRIAGG